MNVSQPKVFLTAEWRNLINLTYEVDSGLLEEYLPKGVEIDTHLNGKAHVSLVAFDFLNTEVKGLKIPFHVNFPEINLRFYVRYKGHVGVVFIREFVPKHCIALVANRIYNEPYLAISMQSSFEEVVLRDQVKAGHIFEKSGRKNEMEAVGWKHLYAPAENTTEHYFKEHSWGFGTSHKGETMCYYVEHPVWRVWHFESYSLNVDFELLYGKKWTFLKDLEPSYKVFAEGSAVKVFGAIPIKDFPEKAISRA